MHNQTFQKAIEVLDEILQSKPDYPGVYRMKGNNEQILYIGKAKNLAKRLANYKNISKLAYRIQNMVSLIKEVKVYRTNTEAEALLLEATLIKEHQPPYNILLKDDKSFPYILVTNDHEFPRITKHRGKIQKNKGKYFGPFASVKAVNESIIMLQKAFLVRPCSDIFFSKRTRPCMEYQIKRCSGPCVDKITKEEYQNLSSQLVNFLSGKTRKVQEELEEKMLKSSKETDYEKATIYRDRIKFLNHIQIKQVVSINDCAELDLIGLAHNENKVCLELCLFRNHQNFGNMSFFFDLHENTKENIAEILTSFLLQFYQNHESAKLIILPIELDNLDAIKTALEQLQNKKISLIYPKRGERETLLNNANNNASTSLQHQTIKELKSTFIFKQIQELFALKTLPNRIEVYDNSHISGTNRVGVMIVAQKEGFVKKEYRKFNIKFSKENSSENNDDYEMLKEVLTRRLNKLNDAQYPDLLLIDGGKGHLSTAVSVLKELNLYDKIPVVCIAKGKERNAGRERFFMDKKSEFTLPKGDKLLSYLQVIRDEAHRFAITSHRNKRSKQLTNSILDQIDSIGKKRKLDLLKFFGSVDMLKEATINEICKVPGINKKTAQIIFNFLHQG